MIDKNLIKRFEDSVDNVSILTLSGIYNKTDLGINLFEELILQPGGDQKVRDTYKKFVLEEFNFISTEDFIDLINFMEEFKNEK